MRKPLRRFISQLSWLASEGGEGARTEATATRGGGPFRQSLRPLGPRRPGLLGGQNHSLVIWALFPRCRGGRGRGRGRWVGGGGGGGRGWPEKRLRARARGGERNGATSSLAPTTRSRPEPLPVCTPRQSLGPRPRRSIMSHEKNRAVVHPYPNARERERSANGRGALSAPHAPRLAGKRRKNQPVRTAYNAAIFWAPARARGRPSAAEAVGESLRRPQRRPAIAPGGAVTPGHPPFVMPL